MLLHRPLFFILFMLSFFRIWKLSNAAGLKIAKIITVSPYVRYGNYQTISAALEHGVPVNNNEWILIHVKPGSYFEKVEIPPEKQYVILQGSGKDVTFINWDRVQDFSQAALQVRASNFVARHIAFQNTYNHPPNENPKKQALAAAVKGDKALFYNCSFLGLQDTLLDLTGRHYFKNCYIEGSTDFIFGGGQSIYEDCIINSTGSGYITAQNRMSSSAPDGFVFKNSHISGVGPTYLGRAYGPYSRVIYFNCKMANIISPLGWDAWHFVGQENKLTYVEANNSGRGSKLRGRVPWINKMSSKELLYFTSMSYIDADSWLSKIPRLN